jgi:hypothetical protein
MGHDLDREESFMATLQMLTRLSRSILLTLGLLAAAILAVALSAVLFLIPIAVVALAGAITYAFARGFWRRLTGR